MQRNDKEPLCLTKEHDDWSHKISLRLALCICCCKTVGEPIDLGCCTVKDDPEKPVNLGDILCSLLPYCPIRCVTTCRYLPCDTTWRIKNSMGMCCNACGAAAGLCCCKPMSQDEATKHMEYCSPVGHCDEERLKFYEKHGYKALVSRGSLYTPFINLENAVENKGPEDQKGMTPQ